MALPRHFCRRRSLYLIMLSCPKSCALDKCLRLPVAFLYLIYFYKKKSSIFMKRLGKEIDPRASPHLHLHVQLVNKQIPKNFCSSHLTDLVLSPRWRLYGLVAGKATLFHIWNPCCLWELLQSRSGNPCLKWGPGNSMALSKPEIAGICTALEGSLGTIYEANKAVTGKNSV